MGKNSIFFLFLTFNGEYGCVWAMLNYDMLTFKQRLKMHLIRPFRPGLTF